MKSVIVSDEQQRRWRLYRGRVLADVPVTYKPLKGIIRIVQLSSLYNSGLVRLFEVKNGGLRYEIYLDGCIFPIYGKIERIDP